MEIETDSLLFDLIAADNFDDFCRCLIPEKLRTRSPRNNFTPFLYASYLGRVKFLRMLYYKGVGIHLSGFKNMKAVHFAALRDNYEALKFLGDASFDLTETCDEKLNALHIASREKAYKCARFLMEKHPEMVNSKTEDGYVPLHFAIYNHDLLMVGMLLQSQADVYIKSDIHS